MRLYMQWGPYLSVAHGPQAAGRVVQRRLLLLVARLPWLVPAVDHGYRRCGFCKRDLTDAAHTDAPIPSLAAQSQKKLVPHPRLDRNSCHDG